MGKDVTIYKPRFFLSLINGLVLLAFIFFLLTLPVLVAGVPIESGKLLGLGGFWLMGIILSLAPLGFRLEVEDNHVRTYFIGFCTRDLQPSNIQVLEYGNLFRAGGLGVGKGLKGWEKTKRGNSKYFSIGEKFWVKRQLHTQKDDNGVSPH